VYSDWKSCNEVATIAAKPAAGPETPMEDPEKIPTITPPIIPAINPEKTGASDAKAIPKHKGTATKKTTRPAGKSCFQVFEKTFIFYKYLLLSS
jgi:cell envelope opacity-associated protein A